MKWEIRMNPKNGFFTLRALSLSLPLVIILFFTMKEGSLLSLHLQQRIEEINELEKGC